MAQKIEYSDNLKKGTDKLNESIQQSNVASQKAITAEQTANQAIQQSESTQTQLDNIVIEGDSSVEAAQARVDSKGESFPTLKSRLDNFEVSATQQLQQTNEILVGDTLYEPPTASTEWATFEGTRKLAMTDTEFLDLFYNPYVGTKLTKKNKGKEASGLYDIWEYEYTPPTQKEFILLSSGMHSFELAASFGLAHFFKHLLDESIQHPVVRYVRDHVAINVIPMINPWGFNQLPEKTYGNANGVNLNRNFDSNGVWATFPVVDPSVDEFNYKGTAPFSEPETRMLRDWVVENNTASFWIDCHTGAFNSAGDNWIYYLSKDPKVPLIVKALDQLEGRIRTKYNKVPTKTVNVDHPGLIRAYWALEQQGMSTMTIEQATKNVPWSGDINNEGPDITEYEVTIWAYVASMLGLSFTGFIPSTNEALSSIDKTLNMLLGSGLTLAYDDFKRPDNNQLVATELGNKDWKEGRGQIGIVGGSAKALTSGDCEAYIDVKSANYTVSANVKFDTYAGFMLRYVSMYRYVVLRINSTGLALSRYENSATTFTKLGEHTFTPVKGQTYHLKAVVKDSEIKVYLDGTLVITATENQLMNESTVGIKTLNDQISTFNNFSITF